MKVIIHGGELLKKFPPRVPPFKTLQEGLSAEGGAGMLK